MTPVLSPNTQAILLLTAPLLAGRGSGTPDLLSLSEYKRLARHLRNIQQQPGDFLSPGADALLRTCTPVIDATRLQRLLDRGFLLAQVVERWQQHAIWVLSRADSAYPRRIKARMREDAPPVLYGCGNIANLETGGLAVVGSRHVDEDLIQYTLEVGRGAAQFRWTVVSGGARGVDQAAMQGALEAGGAVTGVLADSLEKASLNRANREALLQGALVLTSPYDPSAGFNVGHAMQRNKLIYALAEAALVVRSDLNKGGTWAGAVEQLDKLRFVPIYVRATGESSAGLEALRARGARPWPEPATRVDWEALFHPSISSNTPIEAPHLFAQEGALWAADAARSPAPTLAPTAEIRPFLANSATPSLPPPQPAQGPPAPQEAETRALLLNALREPMNQSHLADALHMTKKEVSAWLKRLIDEGQVEKLDRPVRYQAVSAAAPLFRQE